MNFEAYGSSYLDTTFWMSFKAATGNVLEDTTIRRPVKNIKDVGFLLFHLKGVDSVDEVTGHHIYIIPRMLMNTDEY